jgi:predicted metal-dependent hydrolase
MPSVQYGKRIIDFSIHEKNGLRSHYISVDRSNGVVLKGSRLPVARAQKLILKKARWIIDKLERVRAVNDNVVTTGSRLPYLGKQYYVEIKFSENVLVSRVEFNYSSFKIYVNSAVKLQPAIRKAMEKFYKEKAIEKISSRVNKWSAKTGLKFNKLKFVKMSKRWGSCTAENNIVINPEALKLPYSLIDYLIVHELCHTKVKDHSSRFYSLIGKHMNNWKSLDAQFNSDI